MPMLDEYLNSKSLKFSNLKINMKIHFENPNEKIKYKKGEKFVLVSRTCFSCRSQNADGVSMLDSQARPLLKHCQLSTITSGCCDPFANVIDNAGR